MKKLLRSLLVCLCLLALFSLYLHLSYDPLLGKLTLTGHRSEEEIEWKLPSASLQKATLSTQEVLLLLPHTQEIRAFFWGDVLGVRYKVLSFRPFFHWMGLHDSIEIEALCSDFLDLEQKQKFPSKFFPIEKQASSWKSRFAQTFWKKFFLKYTGNFFIENAFLRVEYIPLGREARTFDLIEDQGKLIFDQLPAAL